MDQTKIAKLEADVATAKQAADAAGGKDEALNKALADAESALAQAKAPSQGDGTTRSEKDKIAFNLKKKADEAREQGLDPAEILGIRPTSDLKIEDDLTDETPLTVGTFRKMQKQDAKKTALQMAQELPEDERDDVIELLKNRITPSGNAKADLELARSAVNSDRNAKIAEEIARKGKGPRQTAAGGSSGANDTGDGFETTPEEQAFMRPPYNMSKEKILAARKKTQAQQQ